jgi:hypothetical protein
MKKLGIIILFLVLLAFLVNYILEETRGWRDEQEVYPCECHIKY